jgi:hypothetical protein
LSTYLTATKTLVWQTAVAGTADDAATSWATG